MAREDLLARTFVELADILVDESDPIVVGQMIVERCVELFDASAAGIMLSDAGGHLRAVASSSAQMRKAELFELQSHEGPCFDCFRTGELVADPDLSHAYERWPRFAPVGLAAGFPSVHAIPIRVRDQIMGALNLFRSEVGGLELADVLAAQALAQATAWAILRQRSLTGARRSGNRWSAPDDLVVVEQAKGILSERAGVSVDEAYTRIRRYARHHDLQVAGVSRQVVDGTLSLVTFTEASLQRRFRNRG